MITIQILNEEKSLLMDCLYTSENSYRSSHQPYEKEHAKVIREFIIKIEEQIERKVSINDDHTSKP